MQYIYRTERSTQDATKWFLLMCGKAGRMTTEEAIETLKANYPDACYEQLREAVDVAIFALKKPDIIRCRDCKHQIKNFYEDKRRKDGGYYVYGCELSNDYSHVCLDDDFCSRAERREE